jgi:hypothetical protein
VARGRGAELAYPYFLWVVAAATFLPKVANDYNLVFLLLAMLAAWHARGRPAVHMAMAPALLGLQPFQLVISPRALLLFKLGGLAATGFCLVARAAEVEGRSRSGPKASALPGLRAAAARTPRAAVAAGPTWD